MTKQQHTGPLTWEAGTPKRKMSTRAEVELSLISSMPGDPVTEWWTERWISPALGQKPTTVTAHVWEHRGQKGFG